MRIYDPSYSRLEPSRTSASGIECTHIYKNYALVIRQSRRSGTRVEAGFASNNIARLGLKEHAKEVAGRSFRLLL